MGFYPGSGKDRAFVIQRRRLRRPFRAKGYSAPSMAGVGSGSADAATPTVGMPPVAATIPLCHNRKWPLADVRLRQQAAEPTAGESSVAFTSTSTAATRRWTNTTFRPSLVGTAFAVSTNIAFTCFALGSRSYLGAFRPPHTLASFCWSSPGASSQSEMANAPVRITDGDFSACCVSRLDGHAWLPIAARKRS